MIHTKIKGFSPRERITIQATSAYLAGKAYGKETATITRESLKLKSKTENLAQKLSAAEKSYKYMSQLSKTDLFVVSGVNWLSEYLDFFRGFCIGAHISIAEGAYLQSEADVGCQTLIVEDTETKQLRFLHTEENEEDKELFHIYQKLESGDHLGEEAEKMYHYRLVNIHTPQMKLLFFAYPGLCSWGAAFCLNHKTNTFMVADALFPRQLLTGDVLWASALTAIFAACGEGTLVQTMQQKLKNADIKICGGYATHLIQIGGRWCSSEFISNAYSSIEPLNLSNQRIISQTNCALTKAVSKVDLYSNQNMIHPSLFELQTQLMFRGVQLRLRDFAEKIAFDLPTDKGLEQLLGFLSDSKGDIYTDESKRTLLGIKTPFEAAHVAGCFSGQNATVQIGKLIPSYLKPTSTTHFFNFRMVANSTGVDLLKEAKLLLRRKSH